MNISSYPGGGKSSPKFLRPPLPFPPRPLGNLGPRGNPGPGGSNLGPGNPPRPPPRGWNGSASMPPKMGNRYLLVNQTASYLFVYLYGARYEEC